MAKKQYEQAKELFVQILSIDPDNAQVAAWRKEIDAFEEGVQLAKQQKQIEADINKHAWEIYKGAMNLKKAGKYHKAIETFQNAIDVGPSDKKLKPAALKMIASCKAIIIGLRDPVLADAKKAEDAGDLPTAFTLYTKATHIDPPYPIGYAGIHRIKGVLHERAKAVYIEAVLAESYSDFNSARKFYQQVLTIAPIDDIYHERAERKLAHYDLMPPEAPPQ